MESKSNANKNKRALEEPASSPKPQKTTWHPLRCDVCFTSIDGISFECTGCIARGVQEKRNISRICKKCFERDASIANDRIMFAAERCSGCKTWVCSMCCKTRMFPCTYDEEEITCDEEGLRCEKEFCLNCRDKNMTKCTYCEEMFCACHFKGSICRCCMNYNSKECKKCKAEFIIEADVDSDFCVDCRPAAT